LLLSLSLLKEDIALRFCRRDLGMLVQLLTGYNFLNWYLTQRSFHYSLYVRCILCWECALGPLGGLSIGQLNCCLPCMEEKREKSLVVNGRTSTLTAIHYCTVDRQLLIALQQLSIRQRIAIIVYPISIQRPR